MRIGARSLASVFVFGTVTATLAQGPTDVNQLPQTKYAVEGLAVGSRVKIDSAAYREYKCSPSEQFDRFTWCQKTRNGKERRGAFTSTYSILHALDGKVMYVNRYQEPAFFAPN